MAVLRFGLDASTAAPLETDYTESAQRSGYRSAERAGIDYIHFSRPWKSVETAQGVYDWGVLETMLDETSRNVSVTISVLNFDGTKNLPTYLGAVALDHATVKTAFNALLDDLEATAGNRVEYVSLGQEVEVYLGTFPAEIPNFAALIGSAKTKVSALWTGVPTTVSFKSSTASEVTPTGDYAAILAAVTIPGFTYYFINGDYTITDSNPATMNTTIENEMLQIFLDLGGTQAIILTELGCPSHPDLGSSEALQAQFIAHAMAVCEVYRSFDLMTHANINWEHDFGEWLLDLLGETGDLRKFVGSLGLRCSDGQLKQGWRAFAAYLGGFAMRRGERGRGRSRARGRVA